MRGQKIRLPVGANDAVTPSRSEAADFSTSDHHFQPTTSISFFIVPSNHTKWPPTSASFPPAPAPRRVSSAPSTTRPPTPRTRPLSAVSLSSVPVSRSCTPASENSSFLLCNTITPLIPPVTRLGPPLLNCGSISASVNGKYDA